MSEADKKMVIERLAALLLTGPNYAGNYTSALELAKWLIAEAERLGWIVAIDNDA